MPKSDAPEFVLVHRPWLIAAFQAILIFCSFLGAWFLRFDFRLQDSTLVLSAAPILIVIRLLAIERCPGYCKSNRYRIGFLLDFHALHLGSNGVPTVCLCA